MMEVIYQILGRVALVAILTWITLQIPLWIRDRIKKD